MSLDEFVSLALTVVPAAIPATLPATFTLAAALGARGLARKGVLPTRLSAADEARRLQAQDAFRIEMRDLFPIEIADRQRLQEMDSGRVGLVWPVDGKKNVVGSER